MKREGDVLANKLINLLGIVGIFITIMAFAWAYKTGILMDEAKLADFLRRAGVLAPLVFFIIQFMQTVVPIIPGALTIPMGHMVFGPVKGFILNYSSIVLGSILAFFLCRRYGRRLVWVLLGDRSYQRYVPLLDKPFFFKLFLVSMLVPFMPADIFCMLAGISRMDWKTFTRILLVTKPISLILYTLATSTIIKQLFNYF